MGISGRALQRLHPESHTYDAGLSTVGARVTIHGRSMLTRPGKVLRFGDQDGGSDTVDPGRQVKRGRVGRWEGDAVEVLDLGPGCRALGVDTRALRRDYAPPNPAVRSN